MDEQMDGTDNITSTNDAGGHNLLLVNNFGQTRWRHWPSK